jgi:hypothetical protein
VGNDPRPFKRIATELSGYYLLAFEADERDRDGRVHRVQVALRRGGDVLRSRNAFRLPQVMPSPRAREQDLVALLRAVSPATELPVRVATYAYAEPGSTAVRVVVSAEAETADDRTSEVLIGYVLMDAQRVITASGAHRTVNGRHAFSTVVPPGTYSLRVAGIDPLGRRGLVERPFQTTFGEREGLQWSDLILARHPPPAAGLEPFVDRVSEGRVAAYLELYAGAAASLDGLAVTFEIGREGSSAPQLSVPAERIESRGRLVVARAVISLDQLPPGSYVAHARITAAGQELGVASRPLTYAP